MGGALPPGASSSPVEPIRDPGIHDHGPPSPLPERGLAALLLTGALAIWVCHVVVSLRYPLGNDPAIFQYHAWAMTAGEMPYRDTFEFNSPGIILLHRALGALAGFDDAAFVLFAMVLCGASVAGASWVLRRTCSPLSLAFGVAVATWAFTGITPWDRGQREVFQGVLLLCAAGLAGRAGRAGTGWRAGAEGTGGRSPEQTSGHPEAGAPGPQARRRRILGAAAWAGAAGICAGVLCTIKVTTAALVLFLYGLWLYHLAVSRHRDIAAIAVSALAGFVAPVGAAASWLLVTGAWEGFWFAQRVYLPVHGGLLTVPWTEALWKSPPMALLALGGAGSVLGFWPRRVSAGPAGRQRRALRVAAVVQLGAVALYLAQRHGWTYHLHVALPFAAPAAALAAEALVRLRALDRWRWLLAPLAALPLVVSALVVRYDAGPGLVRADRVGEHWDMRAHAAVADFLRENGPPTDRILVNNDEHQLLLLARRRTATPYLYGFLFSESHPNADLARLGRERARLLDERPAHWVVWNDSPYLPELDSLDANPLLAAWVDSHCTLATGCGPYRVFRCGPEH